MKKSLTFIDNRDLGTYLKAMVVIGMLFSVSGCYMVNQVTMVPKEEKLTISKPIPLEVGLLITEESKKKTFRSPNYADFTFRIPPLHLEPYQLPIGEAFEKAALQIFPQIFQKVHLLHSLAEAQQYPLIIDLRLEDFDCHLFYTESSSDKDYYALVEIETKTKISGTIIRQGKTIWKKSIEPAKEYRYQPYSVLLQNSVGDQASATLVSALKELAGKIVEESSSKPQTVRGWLDEIDQKTGK